MWRRIANLKEKRLDVIHKSFACFIDPINEMIEEPGKGEEFSRGSKGSVWAVWRCELAHPGC